VQQNSTKQGKTVNAKSTKPGKTLNTKSAKAARKKQIARHAAATAAHAERVAAGTETPKAQRKMLACYAIVAPGLEPITARELVALGITPGTTEVGGIAFDATLEQLMRANLSLRTASRVLVRIAEFTATSFAELEKQADKVRWEDWARPDLGARFRVTCRKSRLYHSDAVAERLARALAKRVGADVAIEVEKGDAADAKDHASSEEESSSVERAQERLPQLFVVRFFHDRCTISVDASGALLHVRGYRQAVAKAPLRETLAAAMVLASEWDRTSPLVDPMCGSGTIAIEAALIARDIAPGLDRRFAFLDWPRIDVAAWSRVVSEARGRVKPKATATIVAADRDAGAVEATRANAERAGVAGDVTVLHQPLSALQAPAESGWLVTNPPYGVRMGDRERLHALYSRIGDLARERLPNWTVVLLTADRKLEAMVGLDLHEVFATRNGGIAVRCVVGQAT
jgi:putative N6-adenine-specific DNA methylase